jgi:hypothetical protein
MAHRMGDWRLRARSRFFRRDASHSELASGKSRLAQQRDLELYSAVQDCLFITPLAFVSRAQYSSPRTIAPAPPNASPDQFLRTPRRVGRSACNHNHYTGKEFSYRPPRPQTSNELKDFMFQTSKKAARVTQSKSVNHAALHTTLGPVGTPWGPVVTITSDVTRV